MMNRVSGILTAITLIGASGMAQAQTPLKDVAYVRDGIITVGIAYEISEKCGSISARTFRGISHLNSLRSHARDLGYSNAEIDAYTSDKAEKKRLEAVARAKLAEMGGDAANPATYCAVGRAEIAGNTAVGRLLR